jgi:hypothetical protein
MPTCPPNFAHSFLIVCKIISFKLTKKFFSLVPKGDNRVLKAKKSTFSGGDGLCNILFLSLGELDVNYQNLIPTRSVEH